MYFHTYVRTKTKTKNNIKKSLLNVEWSSFVKPEVCKFKFKWKYCKFHGNIGYVIRLVFRISESMVRIIAVSLFWVTLGGYIFAILFIFIVINAHIMALADNEFKTIDKRICYYSHFFCFFFGFVS